MKKYLLIFLLILPVISFAQFQLDWEKQLSVFTSDDYKLFSALDSDDNTVVAAANANAILEKIAPDGEILWTQTIEINSPVGGNIKIIGMDLDGMDNIYLGITYKLDPFAPRREFSFVKYDKNGNFIFNKAIEQEIMPNWNAIGDSPAIYRDNNGNFVTGGSGSGYTWFTRLDSQGGVLLQAADTVEAGSNLFPSDEYRCYLNDITGELYIGYHMEGVDSLSQFHYGFGMLRLGVDGKIVSQKVLYDFGLNETEAWLIKGITGSDGNMYFSLFTQRTTGIPGQPAFISYLLKIDTDGEIDWDETIESEIGSSIDTRINDISFDIGGNIWAVGQHEAKSFVARYSGAGERNIFTLDSTLTSGLKVTCDRREAITASYDATTSLRLRRVDEQGEYTTQYYIDGATIFLPYHAYNIMIDSDRNILFSHNKNTGNYLLKIYDESTGVEDETLVQDFSLSQNYPNPFNPSTLISYNIASETFVTIKVFDILGREVNTLVNEVKNAGKHEIKFDASGLASGTYIYTINAGKNTQSKKMMVLK